MSVFNGFNPQVFDFLQQLKNNNNKSWFLQHDDFYQENILEPSRDLVEDLGAQLGQLAPGIHIVPKVNGSIYRFVRDTRFSRDKTPYKTHLSFIFWQGHLKRTACPGFYLALRPEYIQLGVGINRFTPEYRQAWIKACLAEDSALLIRNIVDQLQAQEMAIMGEQLIRLPRVTTIATEALQNIHLNSDLIRYKGFRGYFQKALPDEVYCQAFIPYCMNFYRVLLPLFHFMSDVLKTMEHKKIK